MDQQDVVTTGARASVAAKTPTVVAPTDTHLPVPVSPRNVRRTWPTMLSVLIALLLAGGGGYYWWKQMHPPLPVGISFGNGRIEADEIDIATKYAGRVSELLADIGDAVSPGQAVARMDTRDIEQSLSKSEAQAREAQHAVEEAQATLVQQQTQQTLAEHEIERTRQLVKNGWATRELMDQRQQQLDAANAGLAAARARVLQVQHALDAAQHDAGFYRVQIADNTLIAPKAGRIQYRLTNIGEVLPAGGKVLTMLDLSYVYMDIYLPTTEAGKVKIGADARIVLDAYPDHPIPAKVSFVASQSQFTPKTVETQSERDKLMFRVRVRIDQQRLLEHADAIRSGLPGVTYVRWDSSTSWPKQLESTP
ncbi:HlyD family efflux transporter periplasmic adaptor subunit [Bradyrhizobium quebecense]|uniref:HlyD family efflux transporter periplasmic adaptor subunit n=2 Tax=Bradyrhizobium quebecense TaxID=2748629 RepID=A0A973WJW1_9BRAD|nr:HlyD family efflux transporter periplasmic adaptor subunit [Bradyrhizobium quebecense]UGA41448.1 HlyD family efflux transporter periplasmic adaptor subunit [Bradyrhizobium quebecense]